MLLAWVAGLLYEAAAWGASPILLLSGVAVALVWCWLAWSTWSAWRADGAQLTLLWCGPVRDNPDDTAVPPARIGGFRLAQWDAPVRVDVALDLQRWMLLRVTATTGVARQTWLWLQTSPRGPLHQLRTLLYLPSRLTVAVDRMPPQDAGVAQSILRAMASSRHPFKSGSKLRSPVISSRTVQGGRSQSGSLSSESAFPSTLVMRDDDGHDSCLPARAGDSA